MSKELTETEGHAECAEHEVLFGGTSSTDHDQGCTAIWFWCRCRWTVKTCTCKWYERDGGGWTGAREQAEIGLGHAMVRHLMNARSSL